VVDTLRTAGPAIDVHVIHDRRGMHSVASRAPGADGSHTHSLQALVQRKSNTNISLQSLQEESLRQTSAASEDGGDNEEGHPPPTAINPAAAAMGASMNEVQKSITDAHELLDAVSIDKDGTAIPEIQELKRR
jgi:hypothetical protein